MGLNTIVGDGFSGLSAGQRQRLLIARAFLGAPRLMILDEATSSLEVAIEAEILARLRERAITTILVAHRPEVWRFADRVYTLDPAGNLIEDNGVRHDSRLSSAT
jgi:ATP-binding cassette subfamily B protein RaxB